MKTSSSQKRNNEFKNNYDISPSSSTCSATNANKSTFSTTENGTSEIDLDAGENDPAYEFIQTPTNDTNYLVNNNSDELFMDKFDKDYDGQMEQIAEKATYIISNGSFFNCGLYQFLSFLFLSIAWTIGNGWYAYVSVFSGYTPNYECDINSMNISNLIQHPDDKKCSALNIITNETIKCTKWIYDKSQLTSTIITEYDLVCDKNYYFELAYSIEQVGYISGTLIFSFIADKVGSKPVFIFVIIGMSILGIAQYFIKDLFFYFTIGFIINTLACGLESVCVTLVLEMFSTSKKYSCILRYRKVSINAILLE